MCCPKKKFWTKQKTPPPPPFKLNGRSLRYVWNILNEENCKKTDSHDLDLDNFTYNRKDRRKKKWGKLDCIFSCPSKVWNESRIRMREYWIYVVWNITNTSTILFIVFHIINLLTAMCRGINISTRNWLMVLLKNIMYLLLVI